MPEKIEISAESWKSWKDVAEYLDSVNRGMKTYLEAVGREKTTLSFEFKARYPNSATR